LPGDMGYVPLAELLADNGFISVVFNFSGCGESSGNIDLNLWHEDLVKIYDLVSELPGSDNAAINIIGFSAGGAIAARFAALEKKNIRSLMLMATPADLSQIILEDKELMASHFRELGLISDPMSPDDINKWYYGFTSLKAENFIRWLPQDVPLCIVHGNSDTVVPVSHADRIYKAAPHSPQKIILEGAPHQLRKDDRVKGIILEWLKKQKILYA